MRKIAILAVLLSLLCMGGAFASGPLGLTGIGIYGSYGMRGVDGGAGLSLKWANFPVVGLKYNFTNDGYLGASVDWLFADRRPLAGALTYFIGLGAYGGINFGANTASIGLRLPIGLQAWLLPEVELFLAVVPAAPLLPTIDWDIGAELGIRFNF